MAELDFDLFGDPVPEGFGRRGRPPHLVTDRNRNKVMLLLGLKWSPGRIAGALGITLPTLRKYYFRELAKADSMLDRMKASHFQSLFDEMRKGNVAAAKEVGRMLDRIDAALFGIGSDDSEQPQEAAPATRAMGKKEQAAAEARTAGAGSDWGNDLLPTIQ
ncbi:AraC family transcriptional regulator [Sphingosinicella sp. BN140058]|uniref:AraC family transcriptional regulator n=1 Tax=Sphingosinicella sp. BN140058 TaxID=1892855 RepID=UPI001012A2A3|nr:AraC family transcriptional regulator [Sphingosinicella sp. BN140058]QAY77913.1 AraC family transcriptional regulator [Sphingosinicella sp. BN140058]